MAKNVNEHKIFAIESDPVQGTADDAIVSKLSAASLGYLDDEFIECFVKKSSRRSPLINRGYYSRVATVIEIQKSFLAQDSNSEKQIVSFGAGYDTSYFRLKKLGISPETYFEIDFPEVCSRKASIIHRNEKLRSHLVDAKMRTQSSDYYIDSQDYKLLAGNLADTKDIERILLDAGIDFGLPTLFISECVFIYMKPEASSNLIEWVSHKFNGGSVFLCYEQILPDDPFGQTMIKNLERRGIRLPSYTTYPTLKSQMERFQTLGFEIVQALDMNTVYSSYLPKDELRRIVKIEMFDEFEEWHLIQAHYCVVLACNDIPGKSVLSEVGFL